MRASRTQRRPAADARRRRKVAPRTSRRGKYDRTVSTAKRHEEQRAKLLDVATQVFAAKGFASTTVEAIVKRAGMSRRTFYEHFEDLRDVLVRIYDRASVMSFALVERQSRAESDPIERIRSGVMAYFGAVATYPDVAKVIFQEFRLGGPDLETRYHLDGTRYAALLFESLAAAHAAGRLRRAPSEITVYTLSRGVEAVAMRELARGANGRLREIAPEIVELILGAFDPA